MTAVSAIDIRVDGKRLWSDLMAIAELTDPNSPYTRRSFSPLFMEGRKWLADRFSSAGLEVRCDTAGNLIGTIEGSERTARTIMLGSHSDTVSGGGRFDGVAGVIAALEIARSLREQGLKPRNNIEVVDFLAEEPNAFGLSCVGSRGMSGFLDERMLTYSEPGGETLAQAISRVGGDPGRIEEALRSDVLAFFELHIEQGPILEMEVLDVGIVTGIAGIRRLELIFRGEADHAGTTPMHMRKDALSAAAETVVMVRRLAEGLSSAGEGHFVATVGVLEVTPNAANVVPARARLIIDARSESLALMDKFHSAVDTFSQSIANSLRIHREPINLISDSLPAACDDRLRTLINDCAQELRLSCRSMASGAGHDAAFISRIAPAAMVFIPCLRGKSHACEEWAEPDALADGSDTLLQAVVRLDSNGF